MTTNNSPVVAGAKAGLKNMKTEIANELGLANYLTARQNGYVGGYMTKRLVEMAQQQLSGKTSG